MNFTVVTALLCSVGWISASGSEFHTLEVQSGEEVTLLCTNFTTIIAHILWFRLGIEHNASCISSMSSSDTSASFCDGFHNKRFSMTSNTTTLFLKIQQVELSDSGFYFCGSWVEAHSRKLQAISSGTYLKVQEASDELTNQTSLILGGLIIFLILFIIFLVLKIRKLHSANKGGWNPQQREKPGSDDLNYAALSFQAKPTRNLRPASERELVSNVVYAATR